MSTCSLHSIATTRSADAEAYAQMCALFTCCSCRRAVSLDGRSMVCAGTIPLAATAAAAAATTTTTMQLPVGSRFLTTSRVPLLHAGDKAREQRHRMDRYIALLHAKEEAWQQQQQEQEQEQEETVRRQQLHPAIKGSLRSAAGKYGLLAPSPLSPWQGAVYAQLKHSRRCGGCDTPVGMADLKKKAAARARITARLSSCFLYQYGWMAPADARAYVQELWCMLQDGPVPPPCRSSHLTVQRGEFRQNQLPPPLHDVVTPELTASSPNWSHQPHVSRNSSRASLPPVSITSPPTSAAPHWRSPLAIPERDEVVDRNSGTDPLLPSTMQSSVRSHSSPAVTTVPLLPGRVQPVLHMQNIEAMMPQAVKLNNTTNTAGVQKAAAAPLRSSCSSPERVESLPPSLRSRQAVASSMPLTREAFLAAFSNRLMRHVVHESNTDLPLCPRCWKDSLEALQKDTERIVEDVDSFSIVHATSDVVNLVRCHGARHTSEEEGSDLRRHRSNSNTPLDKQQLLLYDVDGIVRLESLQRLEMEVLEAGDYSCLLEAACDAICKPLASLEQRRRATEVELAAASAAYNAQQVLLFFTADDTASGVALRTKNAACSSAFVAKTRPMLLAFPISTGGDVATIAGLRLGQHPSVTSRRRSSILVQRNALTSSRPRSTSSSSSTAAAGADAGTERGEAEIGAALEVAQPLSSFTVEPNASSEAIALQHVLHMQQRYTRVAIGSQEDYVSIAEINNACGYLLLLLQHMVDRHHISVEGAILRPNGEQSTVEVIMMRASPPKTVCRLADFFINERFFSWKTFGTACAAVTAYVQAIVSWMTGRLSQLKASVSEHFTMESGTSAALVFSSLAPASPPYAITQDRVDGFPVRHGDVSEALWTLGMKKLLAVVQWCVLASRDVDNLQQLLQEDTGQQK